MALLGFFFVLPSAYAEENLQSTLKEVAEKVGAIEDAKNSSLKEELVARKEALSKIFDLTLLEDGDLKKKLNSFKNLTEPQSKLKDSLIEGMEENQNIYLEIQKRLLEADSVEKVKQLAIDFKNWRNLVYNPKIEKIVSFNLVFQGKNIIAIAQNRLDKIQGELEKINSEDLIWV